MIMIAAKIVSRASAAAASPLASISETMRATSITVTASASTSVPKGSPTRWATNFGVMHRRQHAGNQSGAEREDEQWVDEHQSCGEQQPAGKRTDPGPDWQVVTKHNPTN
jgi:hypothetical protein